jgi:hypothetical protein
MLQWNNRGISNITDVSQRYDSGVTVYLTHAPQHRHRVGGPPAFPPVWTVLVAVDVTHYSRVCELRVKGANGVMLCSAQFLPTHTLTVTDYGAVECRETDTLQHLCARLNRCQFP